MNVALIGYGKMGKEIEQILLERNHQVILKTNNTPQPNQLKEVDVAIEFSQPESAYNNLQVLLSNQIPSICGTTAWLKDYHRIVTLTKEQNTAFLYASNFSLGVNIFFEINQKLAQLMSQHPSYQVSLEEVHHTQKLDAPSGTAVSLAEGIMQNTQYDSWQLSTQNPQTNQIPIIAKRTDDVPGTHTVKYQSNVDEISIQHMAHNRKGFALGAVIAAEWIQNKKGVFGMKDVLGI